MSTNPLLVLAVAAASTVFGFAAPTGDVLEKQLAAICLPPVP